MHISLHEIDETSLDTLFGQLGYIARLNEADADDDADVLAIGGRQYKRVSADDITF